MVDVNIMSRILIRARLAGILVGMMIDLEVVVDKWKRKARGKHVVVVE